MAPQVKSIPTIRIMMSVADEKLMMPNLDALMNRRAMMNPYIIS